MDIAPLSSDDNSGVLLENGPSNSGQQHIETTENPTSTLPEATQTKEYIPDGPTIETVRAMSEPTRTRRHTSKPHALPLTQRVQDTLSVAEDLPLASQRIRRTPAKSNMGFQRAVQQAQQRRGRSHISPRDTARRLKERAQQSTIDTGDLPQDSSPVQRPGIQVSADLERRARRMQKAHGKKKNRK